MIRDEVLNLAARVLLRACPPLKAAALLAWVGGFLPQRLTREELREAAASLSPRGTCLSRALALAATAPGAEVVIGVRPGSAKISTIDAHAWIEFKGSPLRDTDPIGDEIARLPRQRRAAARA